MFTDDDHYATCTAWPAKMTVRPATFTGAPVAECSRCDYVSVYWDCPCDLEHKCYSDLWVCVDCYQEFHGIEPSTEERTDGLSLWDDIKGPWHLTDNVCANHNGTPDTSCDYCGQSDYDDGMTTFSMASCDGCGSTLGGARYRLAYWPKG